MWCEVCAEAAIEATAPRWCRPLWPLPLWLLVRREWGREEAAATSEMMLDARLWFERRCCCCCCCGCGCDARELFFAKINRKYKS